MSRKSSPNVEAACACGSGASFEKCCSPFIDGKRPAPTAESLMRSRYTAYVTGNAPYLLASWHPDTRPDQITQDPAQRWLGLKVLAADEGGEHDDRGTVEFVARYKIAGRGHRLREISRFARTSNGWQYLDGIQITK